MSNREPNDHSKTFVGALHIASWLIAGAIWFAVFFLPLHVLGYWAFAFPPWLFVVIVAGPMIAESGSFEQLIGIALVWLAAGLIGIAIGSIKRSMAILSISIHALLPLVAMALSIYLALQLNEGNLRGAV